METSLAAYKNCSNTHMNLSMHLAAGGRSVREACKESACQAEISNNNERLLG